MKKLTGREWLKKQISELEITTSSYKNELKKIMEVKPKVYNKFHEWTPLKLILFTYSFNVCTPIIKNTSFFKKKYYIDLFAGSGINKIGKKDFLMGSPLIASLNHSDVYDSMIFCENNNNYSGALGLRLKTLGKDNLKIMKEKYELCLQNILEEVDDKETYSFFFIDPNCMEFGWEFMGKILGVRSDIVFTFMSSQIWRAVCQANLGIGFGKKLNKFFGKESWKQAKNEGELVEIYKNNVLKERTSAPIRTIKIKSGKFHFVYYMFFISNKTFGGNSWFRAIDKVKKEIESNSDVAVSQTLDIIKKRQLELSDFKK